MPTKTRAAYAQVNTSAGSPKSGIPVSMALTVVPENGAPIRAEYVGGISPNGGSTGADGRLNFTFTAPVAGGVHTITASCDKCTNQAIDTIRVPGCPVKELTEIDKLSELARETQEQANLTKQLDEGMDGYSLLSKTTQAAEQCLAKRVTEVVGTNSGYKVTSTIRTFAYQRHLWEIWDKFWDLRSRATDDPSIQERCRTLITKVEGQMGFRLIQNPKKDDCTLDHAHCIRYEPATDDPKHVAKTAFDIPLPTVEAFERRLRRPPPSTVQKEANTCGLNWGGTFGNPDRIHFLLR